MQQENNRANDDDLFRLIQMGQEKAFDALFLTYYPPLCAYARQFVCLDDAEEIVQEIMAWIWENRTICVIETSLANYLFRSVKNRCITLINRNERKKEVMNAIHLELVDLYDDPNFYVATELAAKIDGALAALPPTYREAFVMNRFQHMSYKDIAHKLNRSPKTIDYRIQQALKILRIKLKDYLPVLLFLT